MRPSWLTYPGGAAPESLAKINIQDGTKRGRAGASDDHIRGALEFARLTSPAGSRNLMAPNESHLSVLQKIVRPACDTIHAHNLKGFHELRAVYACERYEQITLHCAPINGGKCCQLNQRLDHETRKQVSYELGHCRIDMVAAYIGGRT